jgi:hypothetical protein
VPTKSEIQTLNVTDREPGVVDAPRLAPARPDRAARVSEAGDRVARLRAIHLESGTTGLAAYCQQRLEQALPQGR